MDDPAPAVALLIARAFTARVGYLRVAIGDLPRESRGLALTMRPCRVSGLPNDRTPSRLRPVLFALLGDGDRKEVVFTGLAGIGAILDNEGPAIKVFVLRFVQISPDDAANGCCEKDALLLCHGSKCARY